MSNDFRPPSYREESGIPIFDPPPTPEQQERNKDKQQDNSYKREQLAIQQGMYRTQVALCVFGVLGFLVSGYEAFLARRSADAAIQASRTARDTLDEMRHGSGATDTHTLAAQAVVQATNAGKLADSAKQQFTELKRSVQEEARLATASERSSSISREALTSVQRPYITFVPGRFDFNGIAPVATFSGTWRNIGNTPAVRAWSRVHFEPLQSIPKNYPYPFAKEDRITPLVLGAHDSLDISPLEIPKSSIRMSGQYGLYYGWIVYKDVFEGTPLHLTRFCMELGLTPRITSNGPIEVKSLARYSCSNCFDKACPDYDERVVEAQNSST